MDELHGFCVRMLGPGETARAVEQAARTAGHGDRVEALAAAATACRGHDRPEALSGAGALAPEGQPNGLAQAVARELALATSRLPERQREALALRELLGLPHDEVARVVGMENVAVAPLLARGRLRLRTELRGAGEPRPECPERERSLRTMALRQDSEAVAAADEDWLIEHLGHCAGCAQAHAAMLEASACYRAWRLEDAAAPAEPDGAQAGTAAGPDR